MKFRAKPFEVQAKQWFKWGDHRAVQGRTFDGVPLPGVYTRQGWVPVDCGDWIITLPDGETYPCKPDVFAMKYEPAPSDAAPPTDTEARDAEVAGMYIAKVIEGLPDDARVHIKGDAEYPASCVAAKLLRALLAAARRGEPDDFIESDAAAVG